jgi:hypothetical protein
VAGLELAYTSITEEGINLRLESRTSAHLVRIQGTQNPDEVAQKHRADRGHREPAGSRRYMRKAADALTTDP